MSYTPNNVCVYLKAQAGALAGMGASQKFLLDPLAGDSSGYARMADAFAQEFDTIWGSSAPSGYEEDAILSCTQNAWSTHSVLEAKVAFSPSNYTGLCRGIIALVLQSNAQVSSEGVDPDGCAGGAGGGSTKLLAAFTQPAVSPTVSPSASVTAHISSTTGMIAGGFLSVVGGGRYVIQSVPDAAHAVLVNIGGPQNVAAGTSVPINSAVSLQSPQVESIVGGTTPYSVGPVFNIMDPAFAGGAVGDGVHDDTAAIQACVNAAALANGTVYFPTPPVVFTASSEIAVTWNAARIVGNSSNRLSPTLKATAPMRSLFAIRTTIGSPIPEDQALNRSTFSDMTLDGNLLATYCIIALGAEFSTFSNLRLLNTLASGYYVPQQQNALTLSAVTPGGGGVGGVTVSEPNPNYAGFTDNTNTVVLKITGGGALGTATYRVSYDNGATFQTLDILLFATINVPLVSNGQVTGLSGIQMTFPARVYAINETYSFTYTFNFGDYAGGPGAGTAQGGVSFQYITFGQNGSVYITSGKSGSYGGFNTVLTPGTMATTSGSQMIVGTGTNFLSFLGNASTRVLFQVDDHPNGSIYQGYVLDDTHIAVQPLTEPTVTTGSLQFAMATYGGYYEDFDATPKFDFGQCGNCSNGLVFGPGGGGPTVCHFVSSSTAVIGAALNSPATYIEDWFAASTSIFRFWFSPNSAGFIRDPGEQGVDYGTASGGWSLEQEGTYSPISPGAADSWIPIHNLALTLTAPQVITAAGQQFVLPSQVNGAPGGSSYIRFTATGQFLMTGTPTIPAGRQGNVICLHNTGVSAGSIILQDNQDTLSGLVLDARRITIAPQEMCWFICTDLGLWKQIHKSVSAYATNNPAGNTGTGKSRVQTVSSTAATIIYQIEPVATGIAPGTCLKFDVSAQSQGGNNVAFWKNNIYFSDIHGNSTFVIDPSPIGVTGGVVGGPPLGWTISMDPTGTSPFVNIYVHGDVSANPVTWIVVVDHRDPGQ